MPTAAGRGKQSYRDGHAGGGRAQTRNPHWPPPDGTIIPVKPVAGFVGVGGAGASAASGAWVASIGGGACPGRGGLGGIERRGCIRGCRRVGGWWLRWNVVRTHPVLAVAQLVRPGDGADEGVHSDRREVVLPVLDDRREVLRAQLRGLLGTEA